MPRSGYGARRSFESEGGQCEDYYGKGDNRCANKYVETGDLETDIELLRQTLSYYQIGSWWHKTNSDELERKLAEKKVIDKAIEEQRLAEEQRTQAFLLAVNEAMVAKIRESTKSREPQPKVVIVSPPEPIPESVKYSPLLLIGIGVIVFLIMLRRRV